MSINRWFVCGKISVNGGSAIYDLTSTGFATRAEAELYSGRMATPTDEIYVAEGLEFMCPACGHKIYEPPSAREVSKK